MGLDVFSRTLALELETDLGRVGRFGDGVFVGPISMGIGLDAAFEKIRCRLVKWSEPGFDIPLSFA